ncbi:MAG: tripartite tricarboxylate transporter substrate binding protein [Betaproteobacteria bacterium]|nr:tripartite tricarboxylate transporter substrate binding protein [Betaproteobacteria bacterium]
MRFNVPVLIAALASTVALTSASAQTASFPSKPIRFMVPFTAGSGTDIIARTVGEAMSKSLGQPVVVENRPGAGGTIAAAQVAKGEADGHLVLIHSSGHALNPAIYPNLSYDTLKDLTGITALASLPNVMVVSPARGWKSVNDAIAAAKAKPGALNYASAGTGSATHLNAEKFKLRAGIDAVHIPFKGTPEAVTEIIGGRIDWFFAPLASTLPLIREGKLQALAVSTPTRTPALPDIPTTVEAGLADSSYVFWVGMIAPSGVPAAIQQRLNDEARKALASPEVRERMARAGADALPMSITEFNAFIRAEMESAAQIAKAANLKAQ